MRGQIRSRLANLNSTSRFSLLKYLDYFCGKSVQCWMAISPCRLFSPIQGMNVAMAAAQAGGPLGSAVYTLHLCNLGHRYMTRMFAALFLALRSTSFERKPGHFLSNTGSRQHTTANNVAVQTKCDKSAHRHQQVSAKTHMRTHTHTTCERVPLNQDMKRA